MPGTVQAVERAAAILTLLAAAEEPVKLVDIAAATGLPKTTAHGLLATLLSIGWVDQEGASPGYRVVGALAGLAPAIDTADLRSAATPWMDRLASETGLEVHLTRYQRDVAFVVQHVYRPDNSPQWLRVGEGLPLHATASGKVLLAHHRAGPARGRLEQFTRFTLVDREDLDAELARVRADRHATERGEFYPDVHSVAVPVRDANNHPVAALAVLGRRDEVLRRSAPAAEPRRALDRAAGFIARALANAP